MFACASFVAENPQASIDDVVNHLADMDLRVSTKGVAWLQVVADYFHTAGAIGDATYVALRDHLESLGPQGAMTFIRQALPELRLAPGFKLKDLP